MVFGLLLSDAVSFCVFVWVEMSADDNHWLFHNESMHGSLKKQQQQQGQLVADDIDRDLDLAMGFTSFFPNNNNTNSIKKQPIASTATASKQQDAAARSNKKSTCN